MPSEDEDFIAYTTFDEGIVFGGNVFYVVGVVAVVGHWMMSTFL